GESSHGRVIRCVEQQHDIVRAHRPERVGDLQAHFLGLGGRGGTSFNGVLDVADTLFGELKKTDIHSHIFSPLLRVSPERLWQSSGVCKSNVPAVRVRGQRSEVRDQRSAIAQLNASASNTEGSGCAAVIDYSIFAARYALLQASAIPIQAIGLLAGQLLR